MHLTTNVYGMCSVSHRIVTFEICEEPIATLDGKVIQRIWQRQQSLEEARDGKSQGPLNINDVKFETKDVSE